MNVAMDRRGSKLFLGWALAVACWCGTGEFARAREGYVIARSGAVHEGHVRFVPGAVIVANSVRETWEKMNLADVDEVGLFPVPDEVWAGGPPGLLVETSQPERTQRISLLGGSLQVGYVASVDDSSLQFTSSRRAPIPTKTIANIELRPVPQRWRRRFSAGEPGVILRTGEFVGGEIRGWRDGKVTVSSIPLGLMRFDSGTELSAVIWRKAGPTERGQCRVRTADGSVWMGHSLKIEEGWAVLKSPVYGARRLPLYEIVELRWGRAA